MNTHHLVAIIALGVVFGLGTARADTPIVYDLTAGPGEVTNLAIGSQMIDVYIDLGTDSTASGVICEDGDGDELCAVDVVLTLTGPGQIDDFNAPMTGATVISEPTIFPTSVLRLNLLQSLSPPAPGPQALGTLTIDVFSSANGTNLVYLKATGQAVNAGGALKGIASGDIAVPEPSVLVLLLGGGFGLAGLHRLRSRTAAVTAKGDPQNPK
jgi:hypothetical protein